MALQQQLSDNAHYVTYTSTAGAVTVWGLHLGELGVIISSLAAICGAVIQVLTYLDRRSSGRRGEETDSHGETH